MSDQVYGGPGATLAPLDPGTPPSGVRCKYGCPLLRGHHVFPCVAAIVTPPRPTPVVAGAVRVRVGWQPTDNRVAPWWAHARGCTAYAATLAGALILLEQGTGICMAHFDVDHDSVYRATCAAVCSR